MPPNVMPNMKMIGPKVKAPVRNAPGLEGTRCEGCDSIECFERKGSRLAPWRFYCDLLKANVDPRSMGPDDCPKGKEKVKVKSYDWEKGRSAAGIEEGAGTEGLDDRGRSGVRSARGADEPRRTARQEVLRDSVEGWPMEGQAGPFDGQPGPPDGGDVDAAAAPGDEAGAQGRRPAEQLVVEPGLGADPHGSRDSGSLLQEDLLGDAGGPGRPEARDEVRLHGGLQVREVHEGGQDREVCGSDPQAAEGDGGKPPGDASALAGYLFARLDALAAVDPSDAAAVDVECAITKAVNDTAKNIINLANACTNAAMLRSNLTGSVDVPGFFLGGGAE